MSIDVEALRLVAKLVGPLRVDRAGYIWGRSEKGGETVFAQVRGWGYLTGKGHGALGLSDAEGIDRQAAWGEMIVHAVNTFAAEQPNVSTKAGSETRPQE